jgi:hypothetical protein
MASYEKAVRVEECLADEFREYITGSATIPDETHGFVVVLYRTQQQSRTAFPPSRNGVKVVEKITGYQKSR